MRNPIHSHATAPLLGLAILAGINLFAYPYSAAIQNGYFREDQPVELLTAYGYLAAAAWLLALAWRRAPVRWLCVHSAAVLLLMYAREQDLHEALTHGVSPFKTKFFIDPAIPGTDKALGLLLVLFAFGILISYAWRYWRPLLAGLRRRSVPHVTTALAVAMLPLAKGMDTLPRLFRDAGMPLERVYHRAVGINEESIELVLPLIVLLAIAQYLVAQRGAGH